MSTAERSRRWRQTHPEQAREYTRRYHAAHPATPAQLARKRELNRVWRAKNLAKVKRYQRLHWLECRDQANARRRAKYAADAALAKANRARAAAWRVAHPAHDREFYRRHREKFTGDGRWSSRAKRLKRAWRKFVGAASRRAVPRETTPNNPGVSP